VETIDPSAAKAVGGLPVHGVAVARVVAGGPAAHTGLEAASHEKTVHGVGALVGGDAIVAVDGRAIGSAEQLTNLIGARKPGDRVTLAVVRDGRTRTVAVRLGDVPAGTSPGSAGP